LAQNDAKLFKTFVTNRVSEIQELNNKRIWKHVPTKENPADILSRGMWPSELVQCKNGGTVLTGCQMVLTTGRVYH